MKHSKILERTKNRYSRQKIRLQHRIEKYSLQCFGASVYKGLQNLEIQIKDDDFWKPKEKYRQVQSMVGKYEYEQEKIKQVCDKERYKTKVRTCAWLRNKKDEGFEYLKEKLRKQNILDLLFLHAKYLKSGSHKKWVSLKLLYQQIEDSIGR